MASSPWPTVTSRSTARSSLAVGAGDVAPDVPVLVGPHASFARRRELLAQQRFRDDRRAVVIAQRLDLPIPARQRLLEQRLDHVLGLVRHGRADVVALRHQRRDEHLQALVEVVFDLLAKQRVDDEAGQRRARSGSRRRPRRTSETTASPSAPPRAAPSACATRSPERTRAQAASPSLERQYPSPRTVRIRSVGIFLRRRPMKTSIVLESRSKS